MPTEAELTGVITSWLSDEELHKVNRYRKQDSQVQALFVRGFLRAILSQYSDIKPAQWRFEYGDKGKPRLCSKQKQQTGLDFNLSHSKDHLLIGVLQSHHREHTLGVDIEHARQGTDIYSIMSHYFANSEVQELMRLEKNAQRERFFDVWALKESYIKATGKGLATSLKRFYFDFSNQQRQHLTLNETQGPQKKERHFEIYRQLPIIFIGDDHSQTEGSQAEHASTNSWVTTERRTTKDPDTVDTVDTVTLLSSTSHWQSILGRLDSDYRFALTVGGSKGEILLEMNTFTLTNLEQENLNQA
ncbi:4'-phosphopantetheinyl transferase superfamily protein [Vibrio sp. 10N.222.51.C12]|uniref:4'-phosphopantetheinyl transferase family protein n=1 Tax=Vibrio sp. 10N.286.49.C2 TaxID=1880856 RepID=UPI001F52FB54|nr:MULTISPECIES: 4'-phosphopantetheinyl transferase superfamily protein [unclassified Vibrio]